MTPPLFTIGQTVYIPTAYEITVAAVTHIRITAEGSVIVQCHGAGSILSDDPANPFTDDWSIAVSRHQDMLAGLLAQEQVVSLSELREKQRVAREARRSTGDVL